jgi:hypothetical protein
MWDIPRLYMSACSSSVQLVPIHPIFISKLEGSEGMEEDSAPLQSTLFDF